MLVFAGLAAVTLVFALRQVDEVILVATLTILGGIALGILGLARFPLFLMVLVAIRTSLDDMKLDDLGLVQPVSVIGVLLIGSSILWLIARRRTVGLRPISPVGKALVFYFVGLLLSTPASLDPAVSATGALKIGSAAALFIVLEQIYSDRPELLSRFLAAAALSLIVPVIGAWYQYLFRPEIDRVSGLIRVDSTFVHPNPLGTYMVLAALLLIGTAYAFGPRGRLLTVLVVLPVLSVLLLTYARAAWGALLLGIFYIASRLDRRLFAIMLVGLLGLIAVVPTIVGRLGDLNDQQADPDAGNPNSLEWRVGYWQEVLPLVAQNPATGTGLDTVPLQTEDELPPHNTFIQAFVEAGVIGLAGLMAMVVTTWIALRRAVLHNRRKPHGPIAVAFAAAALSVFIQAFTENLVTGVFPLWYLSIGVAFFTAQHIRELSPLDDGSTPNPPQLVGA
ncbi:MAG: O-antigen ligase family protein [Actinomycetia bacterium]|nr:O-antigen ligase family protein [Actinomycetes bacterium]